MNMTPEGFRTATYLATQARFDAKKTRRQIQCNPPNVRCGARCIPPTWDCRLKGEGPDPHLRAVKTDPLGGLANIERGIRRTIKGVTKGSFSEVQGGKQAIIRGTVKIVPGNLQQKKELRKKLENRTRAIGTGLLIVTGGLGIHALLMKNNTFGYRNGLGRDINNATRAGVSRVLDAVPVLGAQRARTRNAAAQNVGAAIARVTAEQRHGPEALLNENSSAGRSAIPSVTQLTNSDLESHSNLKKGLKAVNDAAARSSTGNAYTWDERHRSAFWSATKSARDLGPDAPTRISVFAEPTAQEYLANQFQLSADARGSKASLKAALQEKFIEERQEYLTLARQQGFRTRANGTSIDPRDLDRFIRGVGVRSGTTDTGIRNSVEAHVRSVLTREPSTYAGTIYNSAVVQFDSYYKTIARDVRNIPGVAQSSAGVNPLSQGSDELVKSSNRYRSAFLAREMRIRTQISGDAHAELVRMAYYRTNVIGPRQGEFTITDRLATAAASELSGRPITTRTEAIQILNREPGFAGARLAGVATPSSASTAAPTSASPPKAKRPARKRSKAARIADMMRQRNADGTPRYATREAAEAALERMLKRDDATWAPELIRTATYLTVRTDLRREGRLGKPCGASHIPKAHECRKGQSAGSQPDVKTNSNRNVKIALAAGATVTAIGLLSAANINQTKVKEYRANVSESALKAETLAKEMMDEMRQQAASRTKKPVNEVTGYEASVYNFKDKGFDRGFSGSDSSPAYFGQTPNSRGAVVMLSYADDNKFTTRGQGSYKMATNGAFQEIWGEHDILPFANNISQPTRRAPDDITVSNRERLIDRAGPLKGAAKGALFTQEAVKNFDYLRENVNKRGFNPDAVRAAAFVAAQRRLTEKPVHLMSYSNGGNVATETLAILKEMGYRDVKVVNVAGPTFGMFSHGRDNMRTWVSRGDDFWKVSGGAAFQGGNPSLLKNPNIPHGLTEKIDPNNREFGKNWRENLKAKNSYLKDEQLQREAYRFLTVDSKRSQELADEFIWRISGSRKIEGDLDAVLGNKATSIATRYMSIRKKSVREAENWLRDQIEEGMIERWYGGYNPKTVKARQRQLQEDLQRQVKGST